MSRTTPYLYGGDSHREIRDPKTRELVAAFTRAGWPLEHMGGNTTAFRNTAGSLESLIGQVDDATVPTRREQPVTISIFDVDEEVEIDFLTGFTAGDVLQSLQDGRGDVGRFLGVYGFGGSIRHYPIKRNKRSAPQTASAGTRETRIGGTRYSMKKNPRRTHLKPPWAPAPAPSTKKCRECHRPAEKGASRCWRHQRAKARS